MALVTETPLEQVALDTGTTVEFITGLASGIKEVLPRLVYNTVVGCDYATELLESTVPTQQTIGEYYMKVTVWVSGVRDIGKPHQYYHFGKFHVDISVETVFNTMVQELIDKNGISGLVDVEQFILMKQAAILPIDTQLGITND